MSELKRLHKAQRNYNTYCFFISTGCYNFFEIRAIVYLGHTMFSYAANALMLLAGTSRPHCHTSSDAQTVYNLYIAVQAAKK